MRVLFSHFKGKTLTGRLLYSAALWTVLVLSIGGYILSSSFKNYVEKDFDKRLVEQMDNVLGLIEVNTDDQLQFRKPISDIRYDTPYSGHYWQISEKNNDSFKSRSLWDVELIPNLSEAHFTMILHDLMGPENQLLRIAERDVILPEAPDRVFRIQIAAHALEVQEAVAEFDRIIISSLGIIALAILLSVITQVRYALKPIRAVKASLADVRHGRIAQLDTDLPDDIAPLAEEINGLIDNNKKLILRARTHVGNLAHALKTPLSVLMNEAKNVKDKELASTISTQANTMQTHINHHLKRARIAGGGAGPGVHIIKSIDPLSKAMRRLYEDKDLKIDIAVDQNLVFAGEKEDLDEIFGNIMDNAAKWCRSHITVSSKTFANAPIRPMCEVVVEDDGNGVNVESYDRLFERGHRLDEVTPGTGLGLHIVQEIIELSGGSVRLGKAKLGGLKVTLTLPIK